MAAVGFFQSLWEKPRSTAPPLVYFSPCYGVGGQHKTSTLFTVGVLLMPRLPNQQVDLSWTSDICERAGNVGDMKVTDEGANFEFSQRIVTDGMQSPCPSC